MKPTVLFVELIKQPGISNTVVVRTVLGYLWVCIITFFFDRNAFFISVCLLLEIPWWKLIPLVYVNKSRSFENSDAGENKCSLFRHVDGDYVYNIVSTYIFVISAA